jgi:hypothetical protein
MKKEEKSKKGKFYSKSMTLKPQQKIRRKNKKTKLQELYNEGKVTSEEFYCELTKFIKWRLMTDLIRRGYYINGVRQVNFTRDECDACYTHVLHKILNGYDPEHGTLATYVRWQIRGWGQLIIQKQVRTHKYLPKGTVSLDNTNIYNIRLEEYRNSCKCPEDSEELLDYEHFKVNLLDYITKDDIDRFTDYSSISKELDIENQNLHNILGF